MSKPIETIVDWGMVCERLAERARKVSDPTAKLVLYAMAEALAAGIKSAMEAQLANERERHGR